MEPFNHDDPWAGGGFAPAGAPPGAGTRGRRAVPVWFRASARGRYLVAASLVVLGALGVPVVAHAVDGRRTPVFEALRDLPPGHVITRGDLGTVQALAPPASVIAAQDAGSLLGHTVRVEVPAGALLVPGDLGAYPPSGQATVPVAVKAGQYPPDLRVGRLVGVFPLASNPTAAAAGGAAHAAAGARVVGIETVPDTSSGGAVVELLVSTAQAPVLAQAPGVVLVGLDAAGDLP
jgi:hypothetical protein